MEIFLIIVGIFIVYIVIQTAIDRSTNTKLMKEIRDILKAKKE